MFISKRGKSQSSLLLIVPIVGIFLIFWVSTTFLGTRRVGLVLKETKLHKLSSYVNLLKGLSHEALLLSSHQAVQEVAKKGGEINEVGIARTWICNGADTSPSVEEVRFFLSNKTLQLLNDYVKNFRIKDLPKVELTKFKCVDYDVSEESVFSGRNDENFNVGAYGSNLTVSYKGDVVTSGNDVYEGISNVRFWLLYRGFKEWVREEKNLFTSCVCSCASTACLCENGEGKCGRCGIFYSCVKRCISSSASRLEKRFSDDYIKCYGKLACCFLEVSNPSGLLGQACLLWRESKRCNTCQYESGDKLCIEEYFPSYANGDTDVCGERTVSKDVKTSLQAFFTCEDSKYLLSVKDDRKLRFTVGATVSIKTNCVQKIEIPCPKPTTTTLTTTTTTPTQPPYQPPPPTQPPPTNPPEFNPISG